MTFRTIGPGTIPGPRPAPKAWGFGLATLHFVRRGVYCCSAVARAIAMPSLGVSSLDLGRLQPRAALFSYPACFDGRGLPFPEGRLLGRGAVRAQFLERDGGNHLGEAFQVGRQAGEAGGALVAPLVHVQGAIDFELDGMQARGWIAVVLGDEAAGIGLVAAHRIAERPQPLLNCFRDRRHTARAIAVSEHEFRPWSLV